MPLTCANVCSSVGHRTSLFEDSQSSTDTLLILKYISQNMNQQRIVSSFNTLQSITQNQLKKRLWTGFWSDMYKLLTVFGNYKCHVQFKKNPTVPISTQYGAKNWQKRTRFFTREHTFYTQDLLTNQVEAGLGHRFATALEHHMSSLGIECLLNFVRMDDFNVIIYWK